MDQALIQHAQHDIHRHERGGGEQRHVAQRRLKDLCRPLKASLHARGQMQFAGGLVNHFRRLAQRDARRKVERKRHHRELALVVHRKAGVRRLETRETA